MVLPHVSGWGEDGAREWLEGMAENAVDSAHFRFVHNTASVPTLDSYEPGFPISTMRSVVALSAKICAARSRPTYR